MSYADRLKAIDWSQYRTAYGAADHGRAPAEQWYSISEELLRLASSDIPAALVAAHHLWSSLCHQHAYVSSAALPAWPFLLEVLDDVDEKVMIEILDIVVGIAVCTRGGHGEPAGEWVAELGQLIEKDRGRFEVLARHSNPEIRDWAQRMR